MLKFQRNKLVSIKKDGNTLAVHGVLDDDVYSLEIDVSFNIEDLNICSIKGKWNRWTSPECPRALLFLDEAVGTSAYEKDFSQKMFKLVGRKACRHYANLLAECGHSAREAVQLMQWKKAKADNPDLTFNEYIKSVSSNLPRISASVAVASGQDRVAGQNNADRIVYEKTSGGTLIDLHVHTYPASPCSSAPVDHIIEEAKKVGLDAVCLTDHNHVWSKDDVEELRQKHGFLVLRGNEITTNQGDMLVFGLEKDIKGIITLEDLRAEVLAADGFIIVAHPFRGFLIVGVDEMGLTPEKAMERPLLKFVDAVEVMNGKVTKKENEFASKVASGLGLPATGGSDAHEVVEVGRYATRFDDIIKNEQDLVDALKKGRYSPVDIYS
jgi:predicted metal-dependent phosphoesterase TrpH